MESSRGATARTRPPTTRPSTTRPGTVHDADGRILIDPEESNTAEFLVEDYSVFVSKWQTTRLASQMDWRTTSLNVWPDVPFVVQLQRFDIFNCDAPVSCQGTVALSQSRIIRKTEGWYQFKTIFVLNDHTYMTGKMLIESAGPPRRNRFRWADKPNRRDMSQWTLKETICAYRESVGIPGTKSYGIDWTDSPDRYMINEIDTEPVVGMRRLFRFAGYPATQYFILAREVSHECLLSEGGKGMTYIIRSGTKVFAQKGWRLVGSFYGFDLPLKCSNKYTMFSRKDPFLRMQLCMGEHPYIAHEDEWTREFSFYAFDIPVPGTCLYSLQHCVRSIRSTAAGVSRHRLTTQDAQMPWEFRYHMYVFPAGVDDCSLTDEPSETYVPEVDPYAGYEATTDEYAAEGYEQQY